MTCFPSIGKPDPYDAPTPNPHTQQIRGAKRKPSDTVDERRITPSGYVEVTT